MADSSLPVTGGNADTFTVANGDHRQVVIVADHGGFTGRASTFRIPGIAGTVGQKLMSIHNATGSTIVVDVHKVVVDVLQTAAIAVTVLPPIIRLWKVTAIPTGGSALVKVAEDSANASSASVTLLQGASSDGVGTTLAATLPVGTIITSEFAPRLITAAGYEMSDRVEFMTGEGEVVTLRALEGLVLFADYTLATANPTTNSWICGIRWEEYQP